CLASAKAVAAPTPLEEPVTMKACLSAIASSRPALKGLALEAGSHIRTTRAMPSNFDGRNGLIEGLDLAPGRCQDAALAEPIPTRRDPMTRQLIIAAAGMLAAAPAALAQGTIKIAVLGPMAFVQGENHWAGAEMARDEINKAGGISVGGKK